MKLSVRPGKREGLPKLLFDRLIEREDLQAAPEDGVILTIVAKDIYTEKATQRFSIVLSRSEIDMICEVDAARGDGPAGTNAGEEPA